MPLLSCFHAGDEDDADALFPTLEQMSGLGPTIPSNADTCEQTCAQAHHHHLDGHVLSERRQKLAMLEQVLEDLGIEA